MEGPRPVKKEELADLINLINYVFRTSSGKMPDMQICFPLFLSEKNLEHLLIMADNGQPVSHTGLWLNDFQYFSQTMKVGYLGSVCTEPNYRGMGLATTLMEAVLNHLEENGVDLLLVSGGRGLYQQAGCLKEGSVNWYSIPKQAPDCRFDITINPPVALMNELWIKEPLHSKRSLSNFEALVEAAALARCIDRESKVYLAGTMDTPLAYIQAVHGHDGSVFIYEWAGERTVLIEIAAFIASLPNSKEVRWPIPSWEKALLSLMPKIKGIAKDTEKLSGTYKIVRFASFIDKISNYLSERYGLSPIKGCDQEEFQALYYEDEALKLKPKDMQKMLLSGVLPANIPPKMKEAFLQALPLPLPWPIGFDFI